MSRDKIKIEDDCVEVGMPCEAYWEDSNTKGWFEAIILSFGEKPMVYKWFIINQWFIIR